MKLVEFYPSNHYITRNIQIVEGFRQRKIDDVWIDDFDASFGYQRFQEIRHMMPWIVQLSFEGSRCMDIQTYQLNV